MNIFVLDINPYHAAIYHDDVRVNKMCIEYTQLLSTVTKLGYKPTHIHHPAVHWLENNQTNQVWSASLAYHLFQTYERRFNKIHGSQSVFEYLINHEMLKHVKIYIDRNTFPIPINWYYGVSSDCIIENNIVGSYRKYFFSYKQTNKNGKYIAKWTHDGIPWWL